MVKNILILLIGLAVGALAGGLFINSLPPQEPADKQVQRLRIELEQANNRIKKLANIDDIRERMPKDEASDRARQILDRIRRGEQITFDDFFFAFQPFLRDTAPIFDRMRMLSLNAEFDRLTGKYLREFDLSPSQLNRLKSWQEERASQLQQEFNQRVLFNDNATFFDFIELSNQYEDLTLDTSFDRVMRDVLNNEQHQQFQESRLTERAEFVQSEADRKLNRLNNIIELRPEQQDQLFVLFAKSSKAYVDELAIEGIDTLPSQASANELSYEAINQILDSGQARQLDEERKRRYAAEKEKLSAVGLAPPQDWDMLELTGYSDF